MRGEIDGEAHFGDRVATPIQQHMENMVPAGSHQITLTSILSHPGEETLENMSSYFWPAALLRSVKFRDNSTRVEVGGNRSRRQLKLPAEVWKSPLKRAHFERSASADLVALSRGIHSPAVGTVTLFCEIH